EVVLQVLLVGVPCHAVYSCCGLGAQRRESVPQSLDRHVMQEGREPHILVPFRNLSHTVQLTWRAAPGSGPAHVLPSVFPLAGRLSSTPSAVAWATLFGGFSGTTRPYDSPHLFIPGLRPLPSLGGPTADRAAGRLWGLPGPAHEDSPHAQVLRPRGSADDSRIAPPAVLPSAEDDDVGTPN